MANKFVNMTIAGATVPVNVEDVVKVAATGKANNAGAAATIVITYKSGSTVTLSTGTNTLAFTVAYAPTVERAFWDVILDAQTLPWNQPVYPAPGIAWGYTVSPEPQAATAALSAKSSSVLKVNNAAAAAAQTDIVIASIA